MTDGPEEEVTTEDIQNEAINTMRDIVTMVGPINAFVALGIVFNERAHSAHQQEKSISATTWTVLAGVAHGISEGLAKIMTFSEEGEMLIEREKVKH